MMEVEQLWVVFNEGCCGPSCEELWVSQHILQEKDVGLHSSDLELIHCPLHLLNGMNVAVGPHNHLQAHSIVTWHSMGGLQTKGKTHILGIFSRVVNCMNVPYWHEIIPRKYIISAPAGCKLIHWGRDAN